MGRAIPTSRQRAHSCVSGDAEPPRFAQGTMSGSTLRRHRFYRALLEGEERIHCSVTASIIRAFECDRGHAPTSNCQHGRAKFTGLRGSGGQGFRDFRGVQQQHVCVRVCSSVVALICCESSAFAFRLHASPRPRLSTFIHRKEDRSGPRDRSPGQDDAADRREKRERTLRVRRRIQSR